MSLETQIDKTYGSRRSRSIALTVTAASALSFLAACGSGPYCENGFDQNGARCVVERTDDCRDNKDKSGQPCDVHYVPSTGHYVYMPRSSSGGGYYVGRPTVPTTTGIRASPSGHATTVRGGFGGSAHASGGS
jgi:hypothetical protein